MKFVFDRFVQEEGGNALVDWLVLTTGILLLAVSVAITFAGTGDTLADGTMVPAHNTTEFQSG